MVSSWGLRRWVITSIGAAIGAVILYHFPPTPHSFYPPCLFHMVTGLQCPGCGATRAVYHLLHGDVAGAFRFNQLLFVLMPFLAVVVGWPQVVTKPRVVQTIAVVVIGYGIVRNLPFWPYPL